MELSDDMLGGKVEVDKQYAIKTNAPGVDIKQQSRPNEGRLQEKHIVEYVAKAGIILTNTMEEAINHRLNKRKALSFREADCSFRQQQDLSSEFLWAALFEFVGAIFEEFPPVKNGVFELRLRFNKGLDWVKRAPLDQRQPGIDRLKLISTALENLKYPAYAEEKRLGFEVAYLKPEWATWDHYNHLIKLCKYTEEWPDPINPTPTKAA